MSDAADRARALLARSDTRAEQDALALKHALEEVLAELSEAQAEVTKLTTAAQEARRKADDHRRRRDEVRESLHSAVERANYLHDQLQKSQANFANACSVGRRHLAECEAAEKRAGELEAEVARLKQPDVVLAEAQSLLLDAGDDVRATHVFFGGRTVLLTVADRYSDVDYEGATLADAYQNWAGHDGPDLSAAKLEGK